MIAKSWKDYPPPVVARLSARELFHRQPTYIYTEEEFYVYFFLRGESYDRKI